MAGTSVAQKATGQCQLILLSTDLFLFERQHLSQKEPFIAQSHTQSHTELRLMGLKICTHPHFSGNTCYFKTCFL